MYTQTTWQPSPACQCWTGHPLSGPVLTRTGCMAKETMVCLAHVIPGNCVQVALNPAIRDPLSVSGMGELPVIPGAGSHAAQK